MSGWGLWPYLRGYVIIRVTGTGLEQWVNRVVRHGISVWCVSRPLPDTLVLRVRRGDFPRLRRLRSPSVRYRILGRSGLPVAVVRLWRRRGFLLGAVVGLLFFYLATAFVWFVDVEAPDTMPVARIRAAAARAGLSPGRRRDQVALPLVERRLYLEFPEIAWVSVRLQGTRALIQVAERLGVPEGQALYGHMVADRDGVIVQVIPGRGEPVVSPGETVSRGQVLISGLLSEDEEEYHARLAAGQPPYVRAEGQVYARVWYEAYAEAPVVIRHERPTGRRERVDRISVGSRQWSWGPVVSRFENYRETRLLRETPPRAGLPVLQWETVWREELEIRRTPRSREEALEEAVARAREELASRRRAGAQVVHEEVEVLGAPPDGERVRVRVWMETRENIASFEPIGSPRPAGEEGPGPVGGPEGEPGGGDAPGPDEPSPGPDGTLWDLLRIHRQGTEGR